jgi:hypothetical protein
MQWQKIACVGLHRQMRTLRKGLFIDLSKSPKTPNNKFNLDIGDAPHNT